MLNCGLGFRVYPELEPPNPKPYTLEPKPQNPEHQKPLHREDLKPRPEHEAQPLSIHPSVYVYIPLWNPASVFIYLCVSLSLSVYIYIYAYIYMFMYDRIR